MLIVFKLSTGIKDRGPWEGTNWTTYQMADWIEKKKCLKNAENHKVINPTLQSSHCVFGVALYLVPFDFFTSYVES